jgi:hypothetical protein
LREYIILDEDKIKIRMMNNLNKVQYLMELIYEGNNGWED